MPTPTLAALALLTLAAPQDEAPASIVRGELGAELDTYLARLAGHGFAGVAAVAREGELVLAQGYGQADRARGVPMTLATALPLGSVSKHFTAAAVLALEAAGELSLADPLEAFFEDAPPDKRAITLHQLLSHTAGFPAGGPGLQGAGERDAWVRAALATELAFEPGARFGYSNVGYGLLAAVVELVSGAGFEQHLRAALFEPLGMSSTGALLPAWPDEAIAHGYVDGEDVGTKLDRLRARAPGWKPLGDGGLSTTALDMAAWTRVGHTGSDDIFSAVWHWFPEHAAFVFVAANDADAYVFEAADDLERILAGQSVTLAPAVVQLDAEALAHYAGTWKLAGGGAVELEARGGALLVRSNDFEGAALVHPVPRAQVARRRELAAALERATSRAFAGEYGDLRTLLDPFAPPADFEAEHARRFDSWTRDHGPFTSAHAVPGRNRFDEIALVLTLAFEHGERRIEYSFGPREVGSIRFLDAFPRRTVRPLSNELFVDYDARVGASFEVRFRLDEEGRPIAVVLTGEDGKERELAR